MKKLKAWLGVKEKPLRRVLFGLVIACVAAGAIWGALTLVKAARRGAVNVYPVESFAMTDYWGDSSETYGSVTTDKLQKIYISSTQTVKQIFVQEGQTVRKGDRLLAYDTTLSDLQLERARIAVDKAEQALTEAQEDLRVLKASNDRYELNLLRRDLAAKLEKAQESAGYVPGEMPSLPTGEGSKNDPMYIDASTDGGYSLASGSDVLDMSKLEELLDKSLKTELYVALVTVKGERYIGYRGVHLLYAPSGNFGCEEISVPELTPGDGTNSTAKINSLQRRLDSVDKQIEEAMSTKELAEAINDQNVLISQRQVDIKLAQMDLSQKQKEVSDGAVYSEIDGTVKAVRDAQEAYTNGEAVVEVSGGGGYYITGSISELALGTVAIGQSVQVSSWMSGAACEGEVVEIGIYPTNNSGWGDGNNNVSWYPLKVFVSEDANLQEGEGVNMTYQSAEAAESGAWYLESMFIRNENGRNYVMVRGEGDLLEQRFIQTGRDLWGSYTQITGGDLTLEDYMAFPYGQDTVAGARTNESTMDEFYMMAY